MATGTKWNINTINAAGGANSGISAIARVNSGTGMHFSYLDDEDQKNKMHQIALMSSGSYSRLNEELEAKRNALANQQQNLEQPVDVDQSWYEECMSTIGPDINLTDAEKTLYYNQSGRMAKNGVDPKQFAEQFLTVNAIANAMSLSREEVLDNMESIQKYFVGEVSPMSFSVGGSIINSFRQGMRQQELAEYKDEYRQLMKDGLSEDHPLVQQKLKQIMAKSEEMTYYTDNAPHSWLLNQFNNAVTQIPYMFEGTKNGYIGSALGAGIGLAIAGPAGLSVGKTLGGHIGRFFTYAGQFAGDAYWNMREAGVSNATALKYSDMDGLVNGLNEALLDVGFEFLAGKTGMGAIIYPKFLKDFKATAEPAKYGLRLLYYMGSEGAGEFLQEGSESLTSSFFLNLSMAADGLGGIDWNKAKKDALDEAVMGFTCGVIFGLGNGGLATGIDIKTLTNLKDKAGKTASREAFVKNEDNREILKNLQINGDSLTDSDIDRALGKFWDNTKEARDAMTTIQRKKLGDMLESSDKQTADFYKNKARVVEGNVYDKEGNVISGKGTPVQEMEGGGLFYVEDEPTKSESGKSVHTMRLGNPSVIGTNQTQEDIAGAMMQNEEDGVPKSVESYVKSGASMAMEQAGKITFEIDDDSNKLTITGVEIQGDDADLKSKAIRQLASMYAEYDMEWSNRSDTDNAVFTDIESANPRNTAQKTYGLNYVSRTFDTKDRAEVKRWIGNYFSKDESENSMLAMIVQAAASARGMTGMDFVEKYFGEIQSTDNYSYETEAINSLKEKGVENPTKEQLDAEVELKRTNTKGFTKTEEIDGQIKATIYAGKYADPTTFMHELDHAIVLMGDNMQVFSAIMQKVKETDQFKEFVKSNMDILHFIVGKTDEKGKYVFDEKHQYVLDEDKLSKLYTEDKWTRDDFEFEARLAEATRRSGKTLNPELKGFFRRVAEVFRKVYTNLRNGFGNVKLNDEVIDYFDKLYGYDRHAPEGEQFNQSLSSDATMRRIGTLMQEGNEDGRYDEQIIAERQAVIDKYKGTDQWMKAPNGKPTNLNEDQWIAVRTESFKAWFGDWENDPKNSSKVLDKNKEPLVVYHGTSRFGNFDTFDMNPYAPMAFFSSNIEVASHWSGTDAVVKNFNEVDGTRQSRFGIIGSFLNIRDPKSVNANGDWWQKIGKNEESVNTIAQQANLKGKDGLIVKNVMEGTESNLSYYRTKNGDPTLTDDYIVFSPDQIKSSTNNNGHFDSSQDSFLLQSMEEDDVASMSSEDQYNYIKGKYEGTEQYMMAPNGKATNLTERQWVQVRTPNFKKWFGDWENDPQNASKIVDENGEPKVVHHGTSFYGFDTFDTVVNLAWFAEDKSFADAYADERSWSRGYDPEDVIGTYSCFLNMRNPIVLDADASDEIDASSFIDLLNKSTSSHDFNTEMIGGYYDEETPMYEYWNNEPDLLEIASRNSLRRGGSSYDGIIVRESSFSDDQVTYGVNDSNQIKSATDNNGDFSTESDSILLQNEDALLQTGDDQVPYGLYVNNSSSEHFADQLLDQNEATRKSVETRTRKAYQSLVRAGIKPGDRIAIVYDGMVQGYVTFEGVVEYKDEEDFHKDAERHHVYKDSKYKYDEKKGKVGLILTNPERVTPYAIDGRNDYTIAKVNRSNDSILQQKVEDSAIIDEFNNAKEDEYILANRSMQLIDGKLYPPMAAVIRGQRQDGLVPGDVFKAEENPDLATPDLYTKDDKKGHKKGDQKIDSKTGRPVYKFALKKGGYETYPDGSLVLYKDEKTGKMKPKKLMDVPANYDPYIHATKSFLNDQFESAYKRHNLVTVQVKLLKRDLESGYWADKASLPVGEHAWKSGSVSSALKKYGIHRNLLLTQYCQIVRVIPNSEVADNIADLIKDTDVSIPDNTVPPSLLSELKKRNVSITNTEEVRLLNEWYNNHKSDSSILEQIAYHGTGADFSQFSTDHIGEGEGSQMYGWGIYLASSDLIAKEYAKLLGKTSEALQQDIQYYKRSAEKNDRIAMENKDNIVWLSDPTSERYKKLLDSYTKSAEYNIKRYAQSPNNPFLKGYKGVTDPVAKAKEMIEKELARASIDQYYYAERANADRRKAQELSYTTNVGQHVYQVEIPDEGFINYNVDAPEELVEKSLAYLRDEVGVEEGDLGVYFGSDYISGGQLYDVVSKYVGGDKQASLLFNSWGYKGLTYQAGLVMGTPPGAEGSMNFVVFNGDDIEIKRHDTYGTESGSSVLEQLGDQDWINKVVEIIKRNGNDLDKTIDEYLNGLGANDTPEEQGQAGELINELFVNHTAEDYPENVSPSEDYPEFEVSEEESSNTTDFGAVPSWFMADEEEVKEISTIQYVLNDGETNPKHDLDNPSKLATSDAERATDFASILVGSKDQTKKFVRALHAVDQWFRKNNDTAELPLDPTVVEDEETAAILEGMRTAYDDIDLVSPFIRNVVLGGKDISDKAWHIIAGQVSANPELYMDLYSRATGNSTWQGNTDLETRVKQELGISEKEYGKLSYTQRRQLAQDIADKDLRSKILSGGNVTSEELKSYIKRAEEKASASLAEQNAIVEADKYTINEKTNEIVKLTTKGQKLEEDLSKTVAEKNKVQEKLEKNVASMERKLKTKNIKTSDTLVHEELKKALANLERREAQLRNEIARERKADTYFTKASYDEQDRIKKLIEEALDKVEALQKKDAITPEEAFDRLSCLYTAWKNEKVKEALDRQALYIRWMQAKRKNQEQKKIAEKDRFTEYMHDKEINELKEKAEDESQWEAFRRDWSEAKKLNRLRKSKENALSNQKEYYKDRISNIISDKNEDKYYALMEQSIHYQDRLKEATKDKHEALKKTRERYVQAMKERQAALRIRKEKERMAKQIMKKPSANVALEEANKIVSIQMFFDPKFRAKTMTIDGTKYTVAELKKILSTNTDDPVFSMMTQSQLERLTKKSLDEMTLGEVEQIYNIVKALRDEGLQKRMAEIMRVKAENKAIQTALLDEVYNSPDYKEPELSGSQEEKDNNKSLKQEYISLKLSTYNMARKAQMLDGGEKGMFYNLLIRKKRLLQDVEMKAQAKRIDAVNAVIESSGLKVDDLYQVHDVVFDGDKTHRFTTADLMYVYLSNKNQRNRDAVAYGLLVNTTEKATITNGANASIIGVGAQADKARRDKVNEDIRILGDARYDAMYEKARQVVEGTPGLLSVLNAMEADFNSTGFQKTVDLMAKVYNVEVSRESYYLPINRTGFVGTEPGERIKQDLMAQIPGTKGAVEKGYTIQRQDISPLNQKEIDIDIFHVWQQSVRDQEHTLAFLEYVRQLNSIFENKSLQTDTLRKVISSSYGKAMMDAIDNHIKEIADPDAGQLTKSASDGLLKLAKGNVYSAYLGFKLSAITNQLITSPAAFLGKVGPVRLASKMLEMATNWKGVREKCFALSSFMRNRSYDIIAGEISDAANEAGTNKFIKGYNHILDIGLSGLEYVDQYCVVAGWTAIYEQEIERLGGMETQDNVAEAVRIADEYVQETQPQSDKTELAPMFKNKNEALNIILQFQSSLNVVWQNWTYDIPTAFKNRDFRTALGTMFGYIAAGALLGLAHKEITGKDDDDDEFSWMKFIRQFIYSSTTQFVEGVPLVSNKVDDWVKQLITGEKPKYSSSSDILPAVGKDFTALSKFTEWAYERDAETFQKAMEYTAQAVSIHLGLPYSAVNDVKRIGDNGWQAMIGAR